MRQSGDRQTCLESNPLFAGKKQFPQRFCGFFFVCLFSSFRKGINPGESRRSGPSAQRRSAQPFVDVMEMLRRSSVFAAEVFDRSPTDKELVSQAKALCRDYIHSRLNRAGIGCSKADNGLPASGGTPGEVSSVLLWLGEGRKSCSQVLPQRYRSDVFSFGFTSARVCVRVCASA